MRTIAILFAAGLCAITGPAHAMLEVEGYYWYMTPGGDAKVGFGELAGTRADLEDDLGYDSTEPVFGARLVLGQTHQLGVDFFTMDISADNQIDRTIRFQDLVFPIRADVSSSLEATFIRGYYRLNVGSDTLHGGFLAGGQYIDFSAAAASSLVGAAKEAVQTGSPIIGLFVAVQPTPFLGLKGSVLGANWDFSSVEATFVDLELSANLKLASGLYVGGGYRSLDIDAKDTDSLIEVNLTLSGPVAYVGFEW